MTILGDKLQEAINEKKEDINSYVWKGPRDKKTGEQKEYPMIEATYDQLKEWYNKCQQMLYNNDVRTPGRKTLIGIINEQIARCRAELFVRWLRAEKQYSNTKCLEDLRSFINNNKDVFTPEVLKKASICEAMSGVPLEFQTVSIKYVLDACLDLGGVLDNSHITRNFIIKMGLWFTNQELQNDLYKKDPDTGKPVNRLELVRDYLKVDPSIKLRISETGLTYNEFKSIYMLQKNKYSSYTSEQLTVLANKILYRLQLQCEEQAKQWEEKITEINKVAASKGWDVTR